MSPEPKKKGMWMGGLLPLGYDVEDKLLKINKQEVNTVRDIFQTYLKLKSVHVLKENLDKRGIVSKVRVSKEGNTSGGKPLARGALYTILQNPTYIGKIRHKDKVYDGEHEPIIDMELWQRVQTLLDENRARQGGKTDCKNGSLLAGLICDAEGNRLTPSHALKKTASGKKRYRYYISQPLTSGTGKGLRLPATDIEQIVIVNLCAYLNDPTNISSPEEFEKYTEFANTLKDNSSLNRVFLLKQLLDSLIVDTSQITLNIRKGDDVVPIKVPAQLKRCGLEMKVVLGDVERKPASDPALIRVLTQAHIICDKLTSTDRISITEIAEAEKVTPSYITRMLRLTSLSPKIQEAILIGKQPPEMTANQLMNLKVLPFEWSEQESLLGI